MRAAPGRPHGAGRRRRGRPVRLRQQRRHPAAVAAHASCDKGGPKVADHGPGADWICVVTYVDETHTAQEGKFDLQAKSNSCYTAAGPSKLIGLVTITDKNGKDVPNPVFEFDGCFDPRS